METQEQPSCGQVLDKSIKPQGKVVSVIPRNGGTLSVSDSTVIDLKNGTVFIGQTKQDDIDTIQERATLLYVHASAPIVFTLDDGKTYRADATTLKLRKYPGGFRKITINKPAAAANVWLVCSSDYDFNIT